MPPTPITEPGVGYAMLFFYLAFSPPGLTNVVINWPDNTQRPPFEVESATQPRRDATEADGQNFAACHAVLRTYELVEQILLYVGTTPPTGTKTLLFCQKVNKCFKDVIDRSSILQQALFFKLALVGGERFGIDGANPLFKTDCATYRLFTCPFPHDFWNADDETMYCDAATQKQLLCSAGRMYPSHTKFPLLKLQLHQVLIDTPINGGMLRMLEIARVLTALAHVPMHVFASWDDWDTCNKETNDDIYEVSLTLLSGPLNWKWERYFPKMEGFLRQQQGEWMIISPGEPGGFYLRFDRRLLFPKANPLYRLERFDLDPSEQFSV